MDEALIDKEVFKQLPPFAKHVFIVASLIQGMERNLVDVEDEERNDIYRKHLHGYSHDQIMQEHELCSAKISNILSACRKKYGKSGTVDERLARIK